MAIALIASMTIGRLFDWLFEVAGIPDAPILGARFTLSTLLGFIIGLGLAYYGYKNPRSHEFSSEVVGELKKVTWPTKKETQTATVVVIVTTLILSVILGLFDTVWAAATGVIYK